MKTRVNGCNTKQRNSPWWAVVTFGDGCWEWFGAKKDGYGRIKIGEKVLNVHRYVYEKFRGRIPEGLCLDHLCRNRSCCRPSHLEPVTLAENTRRGEPTNRTHCPQGHEYSAENTYISPQGRKCIICKKAAFKKCIEKKRRSS